MHNSFYVLPRCTAGPCDRHGYDHDEEDSEPLASDNAVLSETAPVIDDAASEGLRRWA